MNIQKVLLKVWRAIRDFVARRIDSSVARESKKASCAALRSNASKNAFIKSSDSPSQSVFQKSSKSASRKACGSCTSRALLSLFVASATLLATFVIAPTSALSAGESAGEKVGTEETVGSKSDSAKSESEKKQPEQSESNNTELNKKNTGSSDTLKNNKELKPVEKQPNPAGNNGVDKAKSDETDVNKNVKDAKKKEDSAETARKMERSTNETTELPPECKNNKRYNTFAKCYVVSYYNGDSVIDDNHPILVQRGSAITIKPKFEIRLNSTERQPASMPSGLRFQLEKYNNRSEPVPSWANFEKTKNGAITKVQNTNNDAGFDGSVTLRPNGKWDYGSYKFKVVIYHNSDKRGIKVNISVEVDVSDAPKDDLKLYLYDFGKTQDSVAVSDNKITINPKSSSQGASGGTTGSTDNADVYDSINNKLFIDSKSTKKPTSIYHHMICHKTGSDDSAKTDGNADSYTLDSVNGLNLSNKDGSATEKQTQFTHIESKTGTDKYSVYLNDDYTESSQSWITGTPTKAGTFECKVFAVKDVELKQDPLTHKAPESSKLAEEFGKRVKTNEDIKSLFDNPEQNIVDTKWDNKASIKQGVDWDYKSVTIEVKSSKPQKPEPVDDNLTLKVYPFNGSPTALPDNKISAMIGMELKPYIEATSSADSANKITLRVLCSNGANTGTGSQSGQPSGSSQSAEDFEYKTWSSNLAELGLSVPADDKQTRCKKGDKDCTVAAQTTMEVSIKPTEVGDYQCVVFALKPKALTEFDRLTGDTTQSGILTPTSISSKLTSAKPTAFKEHKDFAALTLDIHLKSNFTLPHTGGQSWNLQLGILAALLVNLLAAGFVVSQSECDRKLIFGRWRGLCNHV